MRVWYNGTTRCAEVYSRVLLVELMRECGMRVVVCLSKRCTQQSLLLGVGDDL